MLQMPLTLSLSPSDGERVFKGQVRGLPVNPMFVIGKWYGPFRHLLQACRERARALPHVRRDLAPRARSNP
jgi:hypothetical protein